MTLSFSTKWPKRMGELAGQPNHFVEKIWTGLKELKQGYSYQDYIDHCPNILKPKIHTIRRDPHDRWKPGMKIHPVINNRTKNRFQFAPVLECVSVQRIEIEYIDLDKVIVKIDGFFHGIRSYSFKSEKGMVFSAYSDVEELAINDGFPSAEAFLQYFNKNFTGKIIHWTPFKYGNQLI